MLLNASVIIMPNCISLHLHLQQLPEHVILWRIECIYVHIFSRGEGEGQVYNSHGSQKCLKAQTSSHSSAHKNTTHTHTHRHWVCLIVK